MTARHADDQQFARHLRWLVVIGLAITSWMSAHTAYETVLLRFVYPAWFAPPFAIAAGVLVAVTLLIAAQLVLGYRASEPLSDARARAMLAALPIVVLCTTSLHSFLPFRPSVLDKWPQLRPVLQLNMVVAVAAALGVAGVLLLDWRGKRRAALGLMVLLAFAVLVPNDDCENYFNLWWLDRVGSSPLMFVPVSYALLFSAAAFLGANFTLVMFGIGGVAVGTLALGLGHMSRWIW